MRPAAGRRQRWCSTCSWVSDAGDRLSDPSALRLRPIPSAARQHLSRGTPGPCTPGDCASINRRPRRRNGIRKAHGIPKAHEIPKAQCSCCLLNGARLLHTGRHVSRGLRTSPKALRALSRKAYESQNSTSPKPESVYFTTCSHRFRAAGGVNPKT